MKLRKVHKNNAVQVEARSLNAWVPLSEVTTLNDLAYGNGVNSDLSMDLLGVLQLGQSGWRDLQAEVNSCDYHVCSNGTLTVPVDPRSFRDFMLFEDHVINASRGYVRRFTNAMSEVIVTADEILPNLSTLQGGVYINGKRVADC